MESNLSIKLVTVLLAILSGCSNSNQNQVEVADESEGISSPQAPTIMASAPLTNAEHRVLKSTAETAYAYEVAAGPGKYIFPGKTDPTINLGDFEKYITESTFEGIRIYPAFNELNNLIMIMCHGNKLNETEGDYLVLDGTDYSSRGDFPPRVTSFSDAENLHKKYMSHVKLFFYEQASPVSPLFGRIRFSRYYSNEEILKFIRENTEGIPQPYADYQIKLEFGYIPGEFVGNLQRRFVNDDYSDNEMQGFTIMMHLIDPAGRRIIDPEVVFVPGDYKGRFLEVGMPCPPRCGSLHQR